MLPRKTLIYIYAVLLLSALVISCKRKKVESYTGNSAISSKAKSANLREFKALAANHSFLASNINAQGILKFDNQGKSYKVNANLNNEINKSMNVSASMFGLFEVAKIRIDEQKVKVDVVSQQPGEYSYDYLHQYVPFKFDLKDLQNLFWGLNLWDYANNSIKYVEGGYVLENGADSNMSIVAKYNNDILPVSIYISTKGDIQNYLTIRYNNFTEDNLPKHINIDAQNDQDKLNLEFTFNKIITNKIL